MSHCSRDASPKVIISVSEAATMRCEGKSEISKIKRTEPPQEQDTGIQALPEELLELIVADVLTSPKPITLREPQERRWAEEIADLRNESPGPSRRKRSAPGKRRFSYDVLAILNSQPGNGRRPNG